MRRWLTRLLWCGWGLLVALLIAAHAIGQRTVWTSVLVYGPVTWWAGVALVIAVLAFKLSRALSMIALATALLIAGPVWEYRTHQPPMPRDRDGVIKVLTCNRGQHHGHSLATFITQQQPDVIAFEESNDPGAYVPDLPEYDAYPHRGRVSEFQLLSKFPIFKAGLQVLHDKAPDGSAQSWFKGARFELQTPSGNVALYIVHLLSPRFELRDFLHGRITDVKEQQKADRFRWEQQALVRATMQQVESETMPTIVCGDFNVPPLGPLYRRMTRTFRDSHAHAGVGYGASFPGDVHAPFTGGQWLRIDYVLANPAWDILRCEVEQQTGSQHSAVVAILRRR